MRYLLLNLVICARTRVLVVDAGDPVGVYQYNLNNIYLSVGHKMGASTPHPQLFNWTQIHPNCFKNRSTQQLISHQQVPLGPLVSLQSYSKRLQISKQNIVKLYHYCRSNAGNGLCEEGTPMLDVYVEGGLTRLQDVRNCYFGGRNGRFGKGCYCEEITRGFEGLRDIYGPFQVELGMVWLDANQRVKVWLNRNPFLNDHVPVKDNLMVLQNKEILLRLDCKCENFSQLDSSIKESKSKVSNLSQLGPTTPVNQNKNQIRIQKSSDIGKNIFYYPPNLQIKPKYPTHKPQVNIITHTPKYNRSQYLSKTQKIVIHRDTQPMQRTNNNNNSRNTNTNADANKNYQTVKQRKNHSTIVSMGTKCSTPKIMFNYECQSNKGTPTKFFHQPAFKSELSSPIQAVQVNFPDKINGEYRRAGFYEQPYIFRPEGNLSSLSFQNFRPSYQSDKSQDIKTPPFQLSLQKLTKVQSAPDKGPMLNLQQVNQRQLTQQLSGQKIKRDIIYQNSYTDRQASNYSRMQNSKIRTSVESCRVQENYQQIEYQIPQKTKILIQKYLPNKDESNRKKIQPKQMHSRSHYMANKDYFMRGRQRMYKISRDSIEHSLDRRSRESKDISQQNSQITDQPEIHKKISDKVGGSMEKSERQKLKRQMEKIFNYCPPDEEETKIRKKVAQKRAFFADLKKEASKILDDKA